MTPPSLLSSMLIWAKPLARRRHDARHPLGQRRLDRAHLARCGCRDAGRRAHQDRTRGLRRKVVAELAQRPQRGERRLRGGAAELVGDTGSVVLLDIGHRPGLGQLTRDVDRELLVSRPLGTQLEREAPEEGSAKEDERGKDHPESGEEGADHERLASLSEVSCSKLLHRVARGCGPLIAGARLRGAVGNRNAGDASATLFRGRHAGATFRARG